MLLCLISHLMLITAQFPDDFKHELIIVRASRSCAFDFANFMSTLACYLKRNQVILCICQEIFCCSIFLKEFQFVTDIFLIKFLIEVFFLIWNWHFFKQSIKSMRVGIHKYWSWTNFHGYLDLDILNK